MSSTTPRKAVQFAPVARVRHLMLFTSWLREIGAPVDRELARAGLPMYLEEMPDSYISLNLAVDFLNRSAAHEGIDDLGFQAGWRMGLQYFDPALLGALRAAPTIQASLESFSRFAHLESNTLRCFIRRKGDSAQVCILEDFPRKTVLDMVEWQNLKSLIEIVRLRLGPRWLPSEISLRSDANPSPFARDKLGDVRIHTGQAETSIVIPTTLLKRPISLFDGEGYCDPTPSSEAGGTRSALPFESFVGTLRNTIIPYLASGYPAIDVAAEIAGTSVRTLQRRLQEHRTSYSEVIDGIRFERAAQLLCDPDLKVIDISACLGYEDSSNFSRAFRRVCGISPRQFRNSLDAQAR